jgi:hypothetical protein
VIAGLVVLVRDQFADLLAGFRMIVGVRPVLPAFVDEKMLGGQHLVEIAQSEAWIDGGRPLLPQPRV